MDAVDLVERVNEQIDFFKNLEKQDLVVEIERTPQGQFRITAKGRGVNVSITHSWGEQRWSFSHPNTIDVVLHDANESSSYSVIMTECRLEDFPELLHNAYRLIELFASKKYKIQKPKWFSISRSNSIYFDDDRLVYKYAMQIKGKS